MAGSKELRAKHQSLLALLYCSSALTAARNEVTKLDALQL